MEKCKLYEKCLCRTCCNEEDDSNCHGLEDCKVPGDGCSIANACDNYRKRHPCPRCGVVAYNMVEMHCLSCGFVRGVCGPPTPEMEKENREKNMRRVILEFIDDAPPVTNIDWPCPRCGGSVGASVISSGETFFICGGVKCGWIREIEVPKWPEPMSAHTLRKAARELKAKPQAYSVNEFRHLLRRFKKDKHTEDEIIKIFGEYVTWELEDSDQTIRDTYMESLNVILKICNGINGCIHPECLFHFHDEKKQTHTCNLRKTLGDKK